MMRWMRTTWMILSPLCVLWIGVTCSLALADSGSVPVPMDVMLVLDNSGSMKQNDPDTLTREVVSTFSGMLAPGSRLGLVLFDEDVDLALELTTVGTPEFTQQVERSLMQVDYQGQRTDLPAGMERAIYELRENGRPEARHVIVFLTDGLVDVGSAAKDLEQARWLREELAQEAKQLGIRIMGIAFTNAADFQLIQAVANTTGGRHYRIFSAAEIPDVFNKIAARIEEMATAATEKPDEPKTASTVVWPEGWPEWWPFAAIALLALGLVAVVAMRTMRSGHDRKDSAAGYEKPVPEASLSEVGGTTGVQRHVITKRVTKIGREDRPVNDVVIPHETVSGKHAEIVWRDDTFYLRDLRSTNGSFRNGEQFSDPARKEIREVALKNRDRVKFDKFEFEFVVAELADTGKTMLASKGTMLRPQSPQGKPDPGAPPVHDDEPRKTELKPNACPNHASWNATELCSQCKKAFCKSCIKKKDGQDICVHCEEKAA